MISKIKRDIFIVIELINPKNVAFLYNKGRDQNDEYRFIKSNMNIDSTVSFAAGEVYFSSIMDNLITQAYYNQSLLAVLKKIILGEDQTTYRKNPLKRYRDLVSANLYLIDFPASLKNNHTNINKLNNNNNNNNENSNINLNNPNNANANEEFSRDNTILNSKITFKDLFLMLLKQKTVLIGVYRAVDCSTNYYPERTNLSKFNMNSNFYYVVTSPDHDMELNHKDKLFVFSQTYPEDESLDLKNKKMINDIKKIDIQNEKNYDFAYFGVSKMNRKNDEKKEGPKIVDQIGEKKLMELNDGLLNIIKNLSDLRTTITRVSKSLDKSIHDAVKNKFKDIEDLNHSSQVHTVIEEKSEINNNNHEWEENLLNEGFGSNDKNEDIKNDFNSNNK